MTAGKPITITQVATGSYTGPTPAPYVLIGELPAAATSVDPGEIVGATATGIALIIATDAAAARTAVGVDGAATVAAEATADGSDAATTQALANALKVTLNDLIAELKTANIIPAA